MTFPNFMGGMPRQSFKSAGLTVFEIYPIYPRSTEGSIWPLCVKQRIAGLFHSLFYYDWDLIAIYWILIALHLLVWPGNRLVWSVSSTSRLLEGRHIILPIGKQLGSFHRVEPYMSWGESCVVVETISLHGQLDWDTCYWNVIALHVTETWLESIVRKITSNLAKLSRKHRVGAHPGVL